MQETECEIFNWLHDWMPKTKYDMASSNVPGVTWSELKWLTGYSIPEDMDLGSNIQTGAPMLKEYLAAKYKVDQDMIVTSTGGSEANFLTFCSQLNPGDEVICEHPGYSPMWLAPRMLRASVFPWYRQYKNRFQLDLEALKMLVSRRTKLVVMTNLHNPSHVAVPLGQIRAAAEIASDKGAKLLIDEMFLDAAFKPQRSAAGLSGVIVTASVSKIYGLGGIRTGWMIADKETARQCQLAKNLNTGASPFLGEQMNGYALVKGRNVLLKRFMAIARRNHSIVNSWIKENSDIVQWIPPAGGFLSFPIYKGKLDSVKLCTNIVKKHKLLLCPGTYFGMDWHFRMAYRMPPPLLKEALGVLETALREEIPGA